MGFQNEELFPVRLVPLTLSIHLLIVPPHKGFHGSIMCEPQVGVEFGSVSVSFFRPLPEFPRVTPLEWNHVFLGLVNKYAKPFLKYLVWTHRHRHFNLFDIPFFPGTLV